MYAAAYKAKRKNNGVYKISKKDMARLRNEPCFYCGIKDYIFTIDHVVPISRGGTHGIGNLVASCKSCNSSKKDKFLFVWKRGNNASN
jgi:5-methylcytosine-specific restriction endonuclease McrA